MRSPLSNDLPNKAKTQAGFVKRVPSLSRLFRLVWLNYKRQPSALINRGALLVIACAIVFTSAFCKAAAPSESLGSGFWDAMLVVGSVLAGITTQEFWTLLTRPIQQPLITLNEAGFFREMGLMLSEFHEDICGKRTTDKMNDLTICALLNYPAFFTKKEIEDVLDESRKGDVLMPLFWRNLDSIDRYVRTTAEAGDRFSGYKIKLFCLPHDERAGWSSPLMSFVKSFSGYITRSEGENHQVKDKLRAHLRGYAERLLRDRAEIIEFCETDSLEFQAIVVKSESAKIYRAVVGFYGNDFVKRFSRYGPLGEIHSVKDNIPNNYGFYSEDPVVVNWVLDCMIMPRAAQSREATRIAASHHSQKVEEAIFESIRAVEKGSSTAKFLCDNGNSLCNLTLAYGHGNHRWIQELDYPRFGVGPQTRKLTYLQGLYHPLLCESSLWSSISMRLPSCGATGRVLDVCCGIGVQSLAAFDKGATHVHALDVDPLSLLFAVYNFQKAYPEPTDKKFSVTLSDGFVPKPGVTNSDQFWSQLQREMKNCYWTALGVNFAASKLEDEVGRIWGRVKDSWANHYSTEIPVGSFDLVVLEPPFVDAPQLASASEASIENPLKRALYDPSFELLRKLLNGSSVYLRDDSQTSREKSESWWNSPLIMQSFSSLESPICLEEYLRTHCHLEVASASSYERNGLRWYVYLLRVCSAEN